MKRFYKNTLISGAFSKALRVVALLCVLFGVSSSAWGATYYIDASCIAGVQQISWLQYQSGSGSTSGDLVPQNTNFDGKTAYQFTADAGKTLKLQLKIVSGNSTIYPQKYDINLTGNNNCIELQLDNNNQLSYTPKVYSSLKCAGACTPAGTITNANFDGAKVNLTGSITDVCGGSVTYGFDYSADGSTWNNISSTNTSKTGTVTQSWTGFSEGNTYYFRLKVGNNTDGYTVSVTIPSSGSGDVNCSNIVYLKPGMWAADNAWFVLYYWNNAGNNWVKMQAATSCDGLYYAEVPDGYVNFKFVRMNPNVSVLDWGDGKKWNETGDLEFSNTGNQYTITDWGAGNWEPTDCTDGCTQTDVATNVLLSRESIVNKNAKTAKLFGYLKATDCNVYTDYGFYYCMVNDGDAPCIPNTSSTQLAVDQSPQLLRGTEFTATVGLKQNPSDALQDGKTYYYRAYATSDKGTILSEEIRSFATDPCIPQYGGLSDKYVDGTPIVYTINADPAFAANDCKLRFKSLQDAIDHLKSTNTRDNDFKYVTLSNGSYNLNQPVEMRVVYYDDTPDDHTAAYCYQGTENVGIYAGDDKPAYANLIEDFNKSGADVKNTLSIKAGNNKAKPWIHHIVIRNSKNIVLDSLCIYSDPNGKLADNALEMDINTTKWNLIEALDNNCNSYTRSDDDGSKTFTNMCDANIVVQNCMIGSAGFTGVHISAYDGVTFKNNDFEAIFLGNAENNANHRNMICYGASAKFMACKNIKFIQNNFRGSHPTLMWLQECQNVLVMNNVFWYTNELSKKNGSNTNEDTPDNAAFRLIHQFESKSNVKNVGIFYNTFYVEETDITDKYNFLYFSNTVNNNGSSNNKFDISSIKFQYNNCYSYDKEVPGKSTGNKLIRDKDSKNDVTVNEPFLGIDLSGNKNFCPNNFWSQYDADNNNSTSAFAFGCANNTFTNVKGQVCSTTASGPATLQVKGKAMNEGVRPVITFTGVSLAANEQSADRYLAGVRPGDTGWTYGAYQSKDEIKTTTIYWVGKTDDWDDRGNWEYITEVEGKEVRERVSCVNVLSEDLHVIVEEIGTVEIAGGRQWPQIPESFTENRSNSQYDEHVSAGLGTGKTPTKFASTIELEYGAGIKGVENLKDSEGNMLYDRAIVHFDVESNARKAWLLVGNVVKPFKNGTSGEVRNVKSGDYFLDYLPQVYMHKAKLEGDNTTWEETFADLEVGLSPKEVYAIQVTEYYGQKWYPAEVYNYRYGTNYSEEDLIPYRFNGRFAISEDNEPGENYKYTGLTAGSRNLLNNMYPCNLNATQIEKLELGTVNIYDYQNATFASTSADRANGDVLVKSQNGFVFIPRTGVTELEISNAILAEGSTRTRSAAKELPAFSLKIDNANTTAPGASNVVIRYDEELGKEVSPLNTPKVFTKNEDTPEAYVIANDGKYTRLISGSESVCIPLGIRLQKAMNIKFEKVYNEGYGEVTLVDTKTQKYYNLLRRDYTTDVLAEGDTEGRFYLNLTVASNEELPEEGDDNNDNNEDVEDDDNVTTEVEETVESAEINIYAVDNSVVRVVTSGATLQTIYVSDMAGHTDRFVVDGNFAELQLPVAQGVYLVQVVCDNITRSEKVVLK